jgi:hypothetical protein
MKRCTYCGKDYDDGAISCAIDGQSLRQVTKAEWEADEERVKRTKQQAEPNREGGMRASTPSVLRSPKEGDTFTSEAPYAAAGCTVVALVLIAFNVFLVPPQPSEDGLDALLKAVMFFGSLVAAPAISLFAIVSGMVALTRDGVIKCPTAVLWLRNLGLVLCLVSVLAGLLFFFRLYDFGIEVPAGRYREALWGK